MRTFKDMIEQGIAQRDYKTFIPATPETDPIVRTYNNCFGLFTDTHMSKLGEMDYVITGSLCRDPGRFNAFLYSDNFGLGTRFRTNYQTASITCLSSFLSKNGLCGQFELQNGDPVYRVTQCPVNIPAVTDYSATCVGCTSDMPVQMSEKTLEVLGKLVESSADSKSLETAMNESDKFNGNDWVCNGIQDGLCLVSESLGKAIILTSVVNESANTIEFDCDKYDFYRGDRDYRKIIPYCDEIYDAYVENFGDKAPGSPDSKGMTQGPFERRLHKIIDTDRLDVQAFLFTQYYVFLRLKGMESDAAMTEAKDMYNRKMRSLGGYDLTEW